MDEDSEGFIGNKVKFGIERLRQVALDLLYDSKGFQDRKVFFSLNNYCPLTMY